MEPINYGVEIQDPTQSFLSAFKTGAAIQDVGLKQQQQQQQMANQKVILDGLAKIRQPGATVDDVANLAMILPKDQSETVLKAFALKTDAQKQNALSSAGKVVSALFAGENDIAQNYLTEQATAMRNSGNEEGAKFLETWRGVTEVNPTASQNFFTAELLRLPGGDKIVENIIKLGGERRAEAQAPAELRQKLAAADKEEADAMVKMRTAPDDIAKAAAERELEQAKAKKAQIESLFTERQQIADLRAKNLTAVLTQAQTQQALATASEKMASIQNQLSALPEAAQKLVNESAQSAAVSKQASSQYSDLAKQLDGLGNSWGALNSLGEWSKSQFGNQDFRTAIQNEYTRLANSAGIKAYKAAGATGGFSDADLNTALQGIPKANANPQIMAQFLRGMAKEQAIAAALDGAKTDWLTQNKGQLGRANKPFIAGDYSVKPGETYADFAERATRDVVKKFTTPAQSTLVNQIPTDRNPQPMAAASSIEAQAEAIIRGVR